MITEQKKVRWARFLIWEGPEENLDSVKSQSLFNISRAQGGMTCIVVEEADLKMLEGMFPELLSKESR